jgi:hypothetical protein
MHVIYFHQLSRRSHYHRRCYDYYGRISTPLARQVHMDKPPEYGGHPSFGEISDILRTTTLRHEPPATYIALCSCKCNNFIVGKKSSIGDKPATKRHQNAITWERLPYATAPTLISSFRRIDEIFQLAIEQSSSKLSYYDKLHVQR